ncbi:MAG TPA: AAA family ATPase [Candidatus Angelobacter sp.]|nr:AAA family ATPase [Candidatus Angelobacter sp.]
MREFKSKPAIRESVPLLIGLMGPSGSGKTYSALRLAYGIQKVTGGKIYGIDTEARRMLHYADQFTFEHLQFDAPFGSLDYLSAIKHCVSQGAKVVIVDSMSHEHEGPGGLLDSHDKELDRLAGTDYAKRERVKFLAWQKPKADRRTLITRLLQMNCNFIFCFRAKESIKMTGTKIIPMGWQPIAGDEFVFEMTVNCLLLPASQGIPTWTSEIPGERQMIKSAKQFEGWFSNNRQLDEKLGEQFAHWAKGSKAAEEQTPELDSETLVKMELVLEAAAKEGMEALRQEWSDLPREARDILKPALDSKYKKMATMVDAERDAATDPSESETEG